MSQALAAPLVEQQRAIAEVCRRFGVERLDVFGSAAQGRFDPQRSDFDFIVRFSAVERQAEFAPSRFAIGSSTVTTRLSMRSCCRRFSKNSQG